MPDNNVPHITVSTPGELGKEFEEEAKKMRTELEKLQEEYNKRSLSVIEKMQVYFYYKQSSIFIFGLSPF